MATIDKTAAAAFFKSSSRIIHPRCVESARGLQQVKPRAPSHKKEPGNVKPGQKRSDERVLIPSRASPKFFVRHHYHPSHEVGLPGDEFFSSVEQLPAARTHDDAAPRIGDMS